MLYEVITPEISFFGQKIRCTHKPLQLNDLSFVDLPELRDYNRSNIKDKRMVLNILVTIIILLLLGLLVLVAVTMLSSYNFV